jgi:hypothetical protein
MKITETTPPVEPTFMLEVSLTELKILAAVLGQTIGTGAQYDMFVTMADAVYKYEPNFDPGALARQIMHTL